MPGEKNQTGPVQVPAAVGVPARIIRFRKNSNKIEISLTPPNHWLPKLMAGRDVVVRMRLHRVTPRGTTYIFYVKRPGSELLAPLVDQQRIIALLDLWPQDRRKKTDKDMTNAPRTNADAPRAAATSPSENTKPNKKFPPEWRAFEGRRVTAYLTKDVLPPQLPAVLSNVVVERAFDYWLLLRWGNRRLLVNKTYVVAAVEEP